MKFLAKPLIIIIIVSSDRRPVLDHFSYRSRTGRLSLLSSSYKSLFTVNSDRYDIRFATQFRSRPRDATACRILSATADNRSTVFVRWRKCIYTLMCGISWARPPVHHHKRHLYQRISIAL